MTFTLEAYGPKPRHAGVAIPIFSLRSTDDLGVGQFSDLKGLADFAKASGMDVIQILPINDTMTYLDWRDSYPYRAISVFALHPLYLNTHELQALMSKEELEFFHNQQLALNPLKEVDYELALKSKLSLVQGIYRREFDQVKATQDFKDFLTANEDWLMPYAAFCTLRDQFGTANFEAWGNYAAYSSEILARLNQTDLYFHIYLQYILDGQLKDAIAYLHEQGVALKGDIAIGIAHDSADAWSNPDLFNMDMQAGAPPDVFAVNGQNWGFPTYNWDQMAKDGYAWWLRRMQVMANYFDAYRLDHILGFFRIWEIPQASVRGLLGHFAPSLGLTPEEIENNYGIPFRPWGIERFTQPFIKDWVIDQIAGRDNRDALIQNYLDYTGYGNYAFKLAYNTQRKIEVVEMDEATREALYQLHENVLFVEDHRQPGYYHPRIMMSETISFKEIGQDFQEKLQVLYGDYFYHRNNDFWKEQAYHKLPAIKDATQMLACGEDLGMVPDNVPQVMADFQILRLILERMPADSRDFMSPIDQAPYLSVVTTSSHDTTTMRQWWQSESRNTIQRYYNEVMGWYGQAPDTLTPEIAENIIDRHLASPAMLAIFPIQDWLAMDKDLRRQDWDQERINLPENPTHYWRYRMHLPLESLIEQSAFTHFLKHKNEAFRG